MRVLDAAKTKEAMSVAKRLEEHTCLLRIASNAYKPLQAAVIPAESVL